MKRNYSLLACNKLNVAVIFIFCIAIVYYTLSTLLNQDVIEEGDWKKGKISLIKANQIYRNCCVNAKLEPGCFEACRYDLTLKIARQVFFENQDRNSCDLDASIERFVKCANGMKNPQDVRPCCLKSNAIRYPESKDDACSAYCNPHGGADIVKGTQHAKCALTFRRILFCHYVNFEE